MKVTTDRGYDVRSGRIQAEKTEPYRDNKGHKVTRNHLIPHANGRLSQINSTSTPIVPLWVYEYETGFSLSGITGQSYKTRSFFPRNRIQQSVAVSCQFPDQKSYGDAIEWIRQQQKTRSSAILLQIIGRTVPVKGRNTSFAAEGYVKSVQRQHQRFVYAPELRFDFLVERTLSPSNWADSLTTEELKGPRSLPDWKTVIEKQGVFRRQPDAQATAPTVGEAIQQGADTVGGSIF